MWDYGSQPTDSNPDAGVTPPRHADNLTSSKSLWFARVFHVEHLPFRADIPVGDKSVWGLQATDSNPMPNVMSRHAGPNRGLAPQVGKDVPRETRCCLFDGVCIEGYSVQSRSEPYFCQKEPNIEKPTDHEWCKIALIEVEMLLLQKRLSVPLVRARSLPERPH